MGTHISTDPSVEPAEAAAGSTTIADQVVAKIAGVAAREVTGVYELGGGGGRTVGALRDRIPGSRTSLAHGVTVEVGLRQAAIDLEVVSLYGVDLASLSADIRRRVIDEVERVTGLEVTEVNITVTDVHVPEPGEDLPVQPKRRRVVAEAEPVPPEFADAIAEATLAVPGVIRMAGGNLGEDAPPRRRRNDVRVNDEDVEVHVVGLLGTPLEELVQRIQAAATPLSQGREVLVHIDDVEESA